MGANVFSIRSRVFRNWVQGDTALKRKKNQPVDQPVTHPSKPPSSSDGKDRPDLKAADVFPDKPFAKPFVDL
jgi:hypothetical protein